MINCFPDKARHNNRMVGEYAEETEHARSDAGGAGMPVICASLGVESMYIYAPKSLQSGTFIVTEDMNMNPTRPAPEGTIKRVCGKWRGISLILTKNYFKLIPVVIGKKSI